MTLRKNRLICLCNGVTEKEILQILKRGAKDLEDVKNFTLASSGCGRCKGEVKGIIEYYFSTKTIDLQQNIEF
jgi:NAD(P)H-nitrite reductase large subunit